MTANTSIEWTRNDDGSAGRTWNVVTGCDKVSAGCDHCYAESIARRFAGGPGFPHGFAVTEHPERLLAPLRWRKPTRVFVNSMSDMFHANIGDGLLAQMFAVMAATPQHTYQILTKRHARMRSLLNSPAFGEAVWRAFVDLDHPGKDWDSAQRLLGDRGPDTVMRPIPNVHLGVSVEDQHWADIRIPALLQTPAAVRFLSCEPLLGSIDISRYLWLTGASTAGPFRDWEGQRRFGGGIGGQTVTHLPSRDLHWLIAGAESGPGARQMNLDWVRSLRDQCVEADVAFFFKQSAVNGKKIPTPELDGRTWTQMPGALLDSTRTEVAA